MYFLEEARYIPIPDGGNLCICVSTDMRVDFCSLMVSNIPDMGLHGSGTQCFPFYLSESTLDEEGTQKDLFT